MTYPTIRVDLPPEEAAGVIIQALTGRGFRVLLSFDLQQAAAAHPHCACPHHGRENCTCQYVMLLAYPQGGGGLGNPLAISVHSHENTTLVSLLAGEENQWLGAILPAVAGTTA